MSEDQDFFKVIDARNRFPLRHRIRRALWRLCWSLFAAWTPEPMFAWRRAWLRAFGAKLHRTARVYPSVKVWYPPHLVMERFTCLSHGVDCYCMAPIVLRERALVSQRVFLCAGTHDLDRLGLPLITARIELGPNSWIAAEAFVGPGVTVGEGAVLGARGVTVKNLERWAVYAGNPARAIRARSRVGGAND